LIKIKKLNRKKLLPLILE